jgi:RNA polymerase sigma factor (sigma-70 family)
MSVAAEAGLAPAACTGLSSGALVARAAGGDARAWDQLVERYVGLLWATARGHGLSEAEAAEVVQLAWLRMAEHLDDLPDPERVGVWLAATARRESLRRLSQNGTRPPTYAAHDVTDRLDAGDDAQALHPGRVSELQRAMRLLPAPDRLLLQVVSTLPTPTDEEVGAALGVAVGSLGLARARTLDRLREVLGSTQARR